MGDTVVVYWRGEALLTSQLVLDELSLLPNQAVSEDDALAIIRANLQSVKAMVALDEIIRD